MGTNPHKSTRLATMMLILGGTAFAAEQSYRADHVAATGRNFPPAYANAICRTAAAARAVTVEQFGFDMPETIQIDLVCDPSQSVRLFNDGKDHIYLTVKSEKDLLKPDQSHIFQIYGICHEIGHLAMYRVVRNHSWLTTAGAEGWAHYIGSRIVDRVYEVEKDKLWPDPYDYRADGMARLKKQLADPRPSTVAQGAQMWMQLAEIVTDKGLAAVLKKWGAAQIDPQDPAPAVREALQVAQDPQLAQWWNKAEPILVFKRPKSAIAARTASRGELSGKPIELSHDDGTQTGKRSIAGTGHAVRFSVKGDVWYLTGVRIYGSRYGLPKPPQENFHIWLCDKDFKVIAEFAQPYSKFPRGTERWVDLPVTPTNVPPEFIICIAFNPTAQKGVYVGYDAQATGNSFTGTPGEQPRDFAQGDWLIRAQVDLLSSADPLLSSR
jgi:hypothetical protein